MGVGVSAYIGLLKSHEVLQCLINWKKPPSVNLCDTVPDTDEKACFLLRSSPVNYLLTQILHLFGCHLLCKYIFRLMNQIVDQLQM